MLEAPPQRSLRSSQVPWPDYRHAHPEPFPFRLRLLVSIPPLHWSA
jgi:hypothetical protein